MRLWRYCLAGLLFNWAAFVFWTVLPIRAVEFKASSTQLALLQTASSIVYVLNSLFSGGLSDRVSRALLARVSVVIAVGACVLTISAGSLGALFLIVPLMGFACSVYWPSIQGALGAEAGAARLEKALGWFNVSWSVGKTLGFVMGGWLISAHSSNRTLWMAAWSALPVLFLYPRDQSARPEETHPTAGADRAVFRTLGYIANFLAFGVGNVFQNQFIKYLESSALVSRWDRPVFFGVFLGAIYATQTLVFVVLQRNAAWTYRRALLYGCQFLCGGAAIATTFLTKDWAVLAAGAVVGVGLGFANASSIYYSLHGPSDHGKYAGLHEAVLGAGSFLAPLAGGALADLSHDLRMPYWLAGGAMIVATALEEAVYRRSSRS
ncbi:MAG TPA: MFS transporter [Planctomycetota bacterium]|nr:MFS transporter [Planctomycetota bacterium]